MLSRRMAQFAARLWSQLMKHSMNEHMMHYKHLAIMAGLSFIAMYILMYAMVDEFENVYNHYNQIYMAGLMAAPMVIIELIVMRAMYQDRRLNIVIYGAVALLGIFFWFGIRQQVGVDDAQLLRAMIPHHAGAILMCEKASLSDSEVQALCRKILESQREEITQMKAKLAESI